MDDDSGGSETSLLAAASAGKLDVVKFLLESGANLATENAVRIGVVGARLIDFFNRAS